MAEFKEVKDSGKRQEFKTGSVRDTDDGKGQPHLIAGEAYAEVLDKANIKSNPLLLEILKRMFRYSTVVKDREANVNLIYESINLIKLYISETEDKTYSSSLRRLAIHYSNGAKKYSKNNWRKGQPISRYYDSAMRHLWACIDNKIDEDHPAALFWNLIAIIQTKIDVKKGYLSEELNDYPFTIEEVFNLNKGN